MLERLTDQMRSQESSVLASALPPPSPTLISPSAGIPAVEQLDPRGAWLLAWSDLRGRPLPVATGVHVREALGLLIEVEGAVVTCHVAYHRRRHGGVEIIGLWDLAILLDGTLLRCGWSERRGRGLAYCRRIRLPLRLIRRLARRIMVADAKIAPLGLARLH